MRYLFVILVFTPLLAFCQTGFFVVDTINTVNETYKSLEGKSGGVITDTGLSGFSISTGNDWAIELWKFLPERQLSNEWLRLESSDTATNYVTIGLDANAYLELDVSNTGGTYLVTTENEAGSSPKSISGVVENRDWYHIIITRSAAGSLALYLDGENITSLDVTGTFKEIYGNLDLTVSNTTRTGPVRLFQHAINSSDALELYGNGTPPLTHTVAGAFLEWTHFNDTWAANAWTIADDSGNGRTGTATGFMYDEMMVVRDYEPQQRKGQRVNLNTPVFLDWYVGNDYFNSQIRAIRPHTMSVPITPKVFYDPVTDKTYIAINDHGGHGGNREGIISSYDHSTRTLSDGVKIGRSSGEYGVADDHPSTAIIVHGGRVETVKERYHNSAAYFRSSVNNGIDFTEQVVATPSTMAYPSFYLSGNEAFVIARASGNDNSTANYLYTKSGGVWAATREVLDYENDWAYPFGHIHSVNSEKIIHYSLRRVEGGEFYSLGGLYSSDGNIFHNIDSSYSHNLTTLGPIDSAEYYNFLVHEVDSLGIGQSAYPAINPVYVDGKHLVFNNEYDTLTSNRTKLRLSYSDGTTPFRVKDIAFLEDKGLRAVIHITGDTYDVWGCTGDVLTRYRTTDFFDTFTHEEEVYSGGVNLQIYGVTENQSDTNEIVLVGEGVSEGLKSHWFIYIYDKTQ